MFTEMFQSLSFHALHNAYREVCQLNEPYLLLQKCVICVHMRIRQIITRQFFSPLTQNMELTLKSVQYFTENAVSCFTFQQYEVIR